MAVGDAWLVLSSLYDTPLCFRHDASTMLFSMVLLCYEFDVTFSSDLVLIYFVVVSFLLELWLQVVGSWVLALALLGM